MVHQGCGPLKILSQPHTMFAMLVSHPCMVAEQRFESHSSLKGHESSTLARHRASMVLKKEDTTEWRFQLVAYLKAVDPRFREVGDDVARRTDLPPDEEAKKAHLILCSLIVGCTKNRPLRLIMETESRDGREALRKFDAEYRSTYRGRQMALLKRIMHPHPNSAGSDAGYTDNLSEWEKVVRVRGGLWQRAGRDRKDGDAE